MTPLTHNTPPNSAAETDIERRVCSQVSLALSESAPKCSFSPGGVSVPTGPVEPGTPATSRRDLAQQSRHSPLTGARANTFANRSSRILTHGWPFRRGSGADSPEFQAAAGGPGVSDGTRLPVVEAAQPCPHSVDTPQKHSDQGVPQVTLPSPPLECSRVDSTNHTRAEMLATPRCNSRESCSARLAVRMRGGAAVSPAEEQLESGGRDIDDGGMRQSPDTKQRCGNELSSPVEDERKTPTPGSCSSRKRNFIATTTRRVQQRNFPGSLSQSRSCPDLRDTVEIQPSMQDFRDMFLPQVPFLYDTFVSHRLACPVASLSWWPGHADVDGCSLQRLIVGTGAESSVDASSDLSSSLGAISLISVKMPPQATDSPMAQPLEARTSVAAPMLRPSHRMAHDGPLQHIECSSVRQGLFATHARSDVLIFDACKWDGLPGPAGGTDGCCPEKRLAQGANPDGEASQGLAWHPESEHLLLAARGCGLRMWDVVLGKAVATSPEWRGRVTDVVFSIMQPHVVATSSSQGSVGLWDSRTLGSGKPIANVEAHDGGTLCAAFGGGSVSLLATGGVDSVIRLWDARFLRRSLHVLEWAVAVPKGSGRAVTSLAWAPFEAGVLAATGFGGRVLIWDLCRIGMPQADFHALDGPPELLFVHAGHLGSHTVDVAWSDIPWLLASASDSSGDAMVSGELQLWRPPPELRHPLC
uniref:Histone-binding protein RBBP4-like N-terminal domain-containing protein n=1 Tax=Noctiluca scintillans TaxID=2966 RepID=A0A7S1APA3_NOCSC|mmetsp:Transcript_54555/g.145657  ORF Transcript_54555/g.145657 Transcript_54555/m.145657 type:complete len:699 (+) Transcript_54555:53-2149(+)